MSEPGLTPYELAFGGGDAEAELFPAIRQECEARGADARDAERFTMLGAVGSVVRDLLADAGAAGAGSPTEGTAPTATDAPAGEERAARAETPAEAGALVREAGRLLYHGYHFWLAGRPLFVVTEGLARELVESPPDVGGWRLRPPAPAGYAQLPRHLFWARIDEAVAPEPVDGFFWTVAEEHEGDVARLELMLALGLRPGRPGFSVMAVTGRVPPGGAPGWAASRARAQGRDFENVLPGGELGALYALTTPAEALKLVELVFWHVATHPEALGPESRAGEGLAFRTIGEGERNGE